MSLPYAPPCTDGKGIRQSHLSEGVIISPEGRPISYMCRACAEVVIDEYKEKMGWEWTFEAREYQLIDPNRSMYVYAHEERGVSKGEQTKSDTRVKMSTYVLDIDDI